MYVLKNNYLAEKMYLLSYLMISFVLTFISISQFNGDNPYLSKLSIIIKLSVIIISVFISIISLDKNNTFIYMILFLLFYEVIKIFKLKIMDDSFFYLILLLLNKDNIRIKVLVKYDLISRIIYICSVVILFLIGFLGDASSIRDGRIRQSFGFNSPVNLSTYTFYLLISLLIFIEIKYGLNNLSKKYKALLTVAIIFITYYVQFYLTSTRGGQISSVVIIVLLIMYFLKFRKTLSFISIFCYFIIPVLAIYLVCSFNANDNFWLMLNDISSNRLYFQNLALNYFPVGMFGNDNYYYGVRDIVIDNQYIYEIVSNGIIGFSIFAITYFKLNCKAIKNKSYVLLFLLCATYFIGIVETSLVANYSLLLPIVIASNNK